MVTGITGETPGEQLGVAWQVEPEEAKVTWKRSRLCPEWLGGTGQRCGLTSKSQERGGMGVEGQVSRPAGDSGGLWPVPEGYMQMECWSPCGVGSPGVTAPLPRETCWQGRAWGQEGRGPLGQQGGAPQAADTPGFLPKVTDMVTPFS